jgi:hypothetical protein
VIGTGAAGLGGTSDAFEFVSVAVTGDVTLITRIPSAPAGTLAANVAVGLMLRNDLSANSTYALIGVGRQSTSQVLTAMSRTRSATGGSPSSTYGRLALPLPPSLRRRSTPASR